MVKHAYTPSTQKIRAGVEFRGQLVLYRKFTASLCYDRDSHILDQLFVAFDSYLGLQ